MVVDLIAIIACKSFATTRGCCDCNFETNEKKKINTKSLELESVTVQRQSKLFKRTMLMLMCMFVHMSCMFF